MKSVPISTVGRGKQFSSEYNTTNSHYKDSLVSLFLGDSLNQYNNWESPTTIISDGAYGVLGFQGDTSDHKGLPDWYENHIKVWSQHATPQTTLWFWNSEIGWASVHPILEKYGWKYVNCNIWDKGHAHIAGNVNTQKIRRFPVVSEVCVQYVFEAKINNLTLQEWLRNEWKRTKLPMKKANEACGVKDAAVRKYLDNGHLWYFPPAHIFEKMALYANKYGQEEGKPYFSLNGLTSMTENEWVKMRAKFKCPHGFTNIWNRNSLRGSERIKVPKSATKSAHLNQKPLDLMKLIIEATTDENDVVWEPFGGLFSASLAARLLNRKSFGCEIDPDYYHLAIQRFHNVALPQT